MRCSWLSSALAALVAALPAPPASGQAPTYRVTYRLRVIERLALDTQLLGFIAPRVGNGSVKLLVLLTKSDKLNRRESNEALAAAQAALGEMTTDEADVGVALFSALSKAGIADAAVTLHHWTH